MAEAELEGVDAQRVGQLVHMGFAGEVVRRCGQRPIRALGQRRGGRLEVDSLVGDLVRTNEAERARVRVAQLPRRDRAVPTCAAADIDHRGRPEVALGELLPAAPANLDRATGGARQPGSLHRNLSPMLAAEAAARVRHDDAHLRFGNAERLGELAAHPERLLGPGPDGQTDALPLSQRGMRLEGHMREIRSGVGCAELDRRLRQRRVGVADLLVERALPALNLHGMRAQVVGQLCLGRLGYQVPLCVDRLQCSSGLVRLGGGHPYKRTLVHNGHARQRLGPREIDRAQRRTNGRRSQDTAKEHARTRHVRGVALGARHDLRCRQAWGRASDQQLRRPWRHGCIGRCDLDALHTAHELPVADGAAVVGYPNAAVGCTELGRADAPSGGGEAQQVLAGGRGGLPQVLARIGHRAAAERADVEGADVGVAHHEVDRSEGNTQLLGDAHRERSPVVLPDVHLTGEGHHRSVGADVDPRPRARRPAT